MSKWYRVTEYDPRGYKVRETVYRCKLWAHIMAWAASGPSSDGRGRYASSVTEVEL